MIPPGAWEIVRHVVRACGRVADERGKPLGGATVTLWSTPAPGDGSAASVAGNAGGALCALLDRTESAADGMFFFLDCPAGQCVATALAANAGWGVGATSFRIADDGKEKAQFAVADITVPAAPVAPAQ